MSQGQHGDRDPFSSGYKHVRMGPLALLIKFLARDIKG